MSASDVAALTSEQTASPRGLALGLLAGAAVALLGGLLWGVVVIASKYNIGFLAFFVGLATGLAVQLVARRPVGMIPGLLVGLLAGVGILFGRYVVFIHALNDYLHKNPHTQGLSVGYFDSHEISVFVHNLGTFARDDFYWLWIFIAVVAAFRSAGGMRGVGVGRRS
jgi:hypothetical protein